MPSLFQTYKMTKDPKTGKMTPVLNTKGEKIPHPKYRGKIQGADGKIYKVTLTRNKAESERLLFQMQDEQDKIRTGVIPLPDKFNKALRRPYAEVAAEYVAWGMSQGGRGKRPWSPSNTRSRKYYLQWWREQLRLENMGDLNETILPRAEAALRELQGQGKSGKTLNEYRDGLLCFCSWCKKRRYLAENPVEIMDKFNDTPRTVRRDMTPEEMEAILSHSEPHERILFETALCTGFRVNELRSLTREHLRPEINRIWLSAEVDKGRQERLQPVTPELMRRLIAYGESGEAKELYRKHPASESTRRITPDNPLLFVPIHAARMFNKVLERAGIPKHTSKGTLDVHACRTAYTNMILRSGADTKTLQTLTRQTDLKVALFNYGRDSESHLEAAAEKVAARVFVQSERPILGQQENLATFNKNASPELSRGCSEKEMVGETGFEPAASSSRTKRATKLRHSPKEVRKGGS